MRKCFIILMFLGLCGMASAQNTTTLNDFKNSSSVKSESTKMGQHLDATEDISVHLLEPSFVRELLLNNQILQALMAAPLWKYFYDKER